MGINRRNKTSAEFSMSSLTDIIFLLLIFFMLTSTLVRIQNVELPRSDSKTVAPVSVTVTIMKDGKHLVNDEPVPEAALDRAIAEKVRESPGDPDYTVTIVAEVGTPFEYVVHIMEIASRLKVKAIIATQPLDS